ncbi:MAG TPA: O-antigen ligase family protein [Patescibacteria group bacterium]|nr:O-antigen ligase family protein [Patescibacteria group bacterium]
MTRARLFCCLCAGLWLGALFFSLPLLRPYEIPRLVCIGCLFTAVGLALGWRLSSPDGLRWPRSRLLPVAGLFWLVIIASVFTSAVPFVAFIAACSFSLLPGSVLLLLAVPERGLFVRICGWGGGIILAALAFWVPLQFILFPNLLIYGQVRWPFANPDSYAALLMLGFFPALGAMMTSGGERNIALILTALTLAAIVVIGSAGVLLTLAAGLTIFQLTVRNCPQKRVFFLSLAIIALIAFLLPSFLHYIQPHAYRIDFLGGGQGKAESLRVRTAIWRGTAAMIAQHPLLGTGNGTFFLYYPQYRLAADTDSGGFMAHNDPLQFWAEAGILAPVLFYIFLLLAGLRMIAVLRQLPPESADRARIAGLFCALAALAAHAHIDFDLNQASILVACGLLLGSWHETTGEALQEPRKVLALPTRWPSSAGWALALLPVIGILFVLQGFLLSERYVNRAVDELDRGNMTAFAADINRADRVGFGMNARAYVMAASVPLETVESPFALLPGDGKKPHYDKAEELLAKAQARNPRLVAIPYDRARLARNRNDREVQERYLKQALALNPAHLPSRVMLASLYNREGKNADGLKVLKDGLIWPRVKTGMAEGASDYFNMLLILGAANNDHEAMAAARAGLVLLYGPKGKTVIPQVPVR